jgi:hypothetical protein
MAVAFESKMTGGNGDSGRCQQTDNGTSCSTTGHTVGATATLLVATISFGNGSGQAEPTSLSATWNGVAMSAGPTVRSASGNDDAKVAMFTLVSPAAGANTLAISWTTTRDAYMSSVAFSGTDTTTGINTSDNNTATQATAITVTSDADGATVAVFAVNGSDPTVDQTEIFSTAPLDPGGAASYAIGGTSNTHNFTSGGGTRQALAGVHVIAASSGTPSVPINASPLFIMGMS